MFSGVWIIGRVFALVLVLGHTESYDMTPVTVAPGEETLPTYEQVVHEVMEFEAERSPTLVPTEVKLRFEDAIDLCEELTKHEDIVGELGSKKVFEYVPVTPMEGFKAPTFKSPCFGWIRKRCVGFPRPPFDYRCHFWVPFVVPSLMTDCTNDQVDKVRRRKKRLAANFDSPVVSGLEAFTLCGTARRLSFGDTVQLYSLALPLNEGMRLRCHNFKLSPEGGWIRRSLSPQACQAINLRRPEGSVRTDAQETGDDYEDIIKCESRDTLVDCRFQENNGPEE